MGKQKVSLNMANWYKQSKKTEDNWDEMVDWFNKRTDRHIKSVQDYCKKIENSFNGLFAGLMGQAKNHDKSKLENPELDPYIYVTWKYKCKDDGIDFECPDGMDEKMDEATEHHVLNNSPHPEYHCDKKENVINEDDRDKPPDQIIDASKMKDIDIAEMCADWCAMSKEKGNTPHKWAKDNINKRWKFTQKQEDLIYEILDAVWD